MHDISILRNDVLLATPDCCWLHRTVVHLLLEISICLPLSVLLMQAVLLDGGPNACPPSPICLEEIE